MIGQPVIDSTGDLTAGQSGLQRPANNFHAGKRELPITLSGRCDQHALDVLCNLVPELMVSSGGKRRRHLRREKELEAIRDKIRKTKQIVADLREIMGYIDAFEASGC